MQAPSIWMIREVCELTFSKSNCLRSLRCSSFAVSSDIDGLSSVRTDDKICLSLIILSLHAGDTHRAASNETGERKENMMADNSAGKRSKRSKILGLGQMLPAAF